MIPRRRRRGSPDFLGREAAPSLTSTMCTYQITGSLRAYGRVSRELERYPYYAMQGIEQSATVPVIGTSNYCCLCRRTSPVQRISILRLRRHRQSLFGPDLAIIISSLTSGSPFRTRRLQYHCYQPSLVQDPILQSSLNNQQSTGPGSYNLLSTFEPTVNIAWGCLHDTSTSSPRESRFSGARSCTFPY